MYHYVKKIMQILVSANMKASYVYSTSHPITHLMQTNGIFSLILQVWSEYTLELTHIGQWCQKSLV
jgi:hypothetical protein